jgi:hypothetical protein
MKIKNEYSCDVHLKCINEMTLTGHVQTPVSYWTISSPDILQYKHNFESGYSAVPNTISSPDILQYQHNFESGYSAVPTQFRVRIFCSTNTISSPDIRQYQHNFKSGYSAVPTQFQVRIVCSTNTHFK